MSFSTFHLLYLLILSFLNLVIAAPTNTTLVARKDYEPGDTLNRTMCFCTNDNNFAQSDNDPYSFTSAPPDHKVAIVYDFDYYNHRYQLLTKPLLPSIDHAFTLHVLATSPPFPRHPVCKNPEKHLNSLHQPSAKKPTDSPNPPDTCLTRPNPDDNDAHQGTLLNSCLDWLSQRKEWCNTFYTADVPKGVKYHSWEFCYQFRGDNFHDPKRRDSWTFYKDKRDLPRQRDWMADEDEVRGRCEAVCGDAWGMEVFGDRMGAVFSRMDYFHVSSFILFRGLGRRFLRGFWGV
ncbi:MAG: hypothetical protein LQ338_005623 [Usnochroma carphineum]|nr:MAG: hypothetical protein LQ338_005623 [Usnochroma carphineum]